MCPRLFRAYGMAKKLGPDFSQYAVRPILEMIMLRTSMMTEFKLPDGSIACVGRDMPTVRVRTVELQASSSVRNTLREFIASTQSNLFTKAGSSLPMHIGRGATLPQPSIRMSGNVYRQLGLASTHVYFIHLTKPRARVVKMLKDFDGMVEMSDQGITVPVGIRHLKRKRPEALVTKDGSMPTPDENRRTAALAAKDKPEVAGGAKEANRVASQDSTSGLHWLYLMLRAGPEYRFPTDRYSIIAFIVEKSPKLAYAVKESIRHQEAGTRVLIYVNYPLTS
ncbi:hypothetical protein TPAR_00367, partial [Tolypocladium paradoxum]